MYKLTPIVKKVLIINISIYLLTVVFRIDLINLFGLRDIHSVYFRPYQILTHLFVHASFTHLLSNMLTLSTFGPIIENVLSSKRFLSFYLITGMGASIFYLICLYFGDADLRFYNQYLLNPDPESFSNFLRDHHRALYNNYYGFIYDFLHDSYNPAFVDKSIAILKYLCSIKYDVPIVGASGAIFGLLGAFAFLFPKTKIGLIFFPIPIESQYFIIFYGLYELYASFQNNPNDNIAHLAHLGGILIAYIYIKIINRKKNQIY